MNTPFGQNAPVERRQRSGPQQKLSDRLPIGFDLNNPGAMHGYVLGGRYVLTEHQGTGGMAIVYRAYDKRTGHDVAVKILRPDLVAQDANYVSRFQREAEAASKMTHHNIVNLLDVGMEGTTRYLVMEFVEGQTLKELITRRGRIAPETAAQFTIRILSALQHAHERNIVHRDIKPQNILVDKQGYVKVADFGIARIASKQTLTKGDTVMGSVHYFSPEQALGKGADARSDIYSVGVVLYEMLTGRLPFDGEEPVAIAFQQVHDEPPPIDKIAPDVPVPIECVCRMAMEKDPRNRYQSARDMATDLQYALEGNTAAMLARPDRLASPASPGTRQGGTRPAGKAASVLKRINVRRVLGWAGTLLVAASVCWGLYVGGAAIYDSVINSTTVPDFVYQDITVAQRVASQNKLNILTVENYDPNSTAGTVIQQSPQAGTSLKKGDTVVLTVSRGPASLVVPNVVGMGEVEAVAAAEKVGMKPRVEYRISTEREPGSVVEQDPVGGIQIPSESNVLKIYISGGSVTVPSVAGKTLAEAEAALSGVGLTLASPVKYTDTEDGSLHGLVADQSPEPGSQVMRDGRISISLWRVRSMMATAEVTLDLPVSESMMNVRVSLDNGSSAFDAYTGQFTSDASRHPTVTLSCMEAGTYMMRVYCDEVMIYQKELVME